MDFAIALCTPSGETFAYSPLVGIPFSVYASDAGAFIDSYKSIDEGDVLISNDVFALQGFITHPSDLCLMKPVFWKGNLVCFVWTFTHCTDIGGAVPGSISVQNYEVYQEGIRIPPLKLFEKGKLNESLAEIYRANVRTPEYNWGDLTAQLGAMSVIEDEMHLLIDQYDLETIVQARDDVLDWAEEKSRNVIRTMPTGIFEFVEFLDDDGVTDIPVAIKVSMTIRSDGIDLDFTGTEPQVKSGINLPTGGKEHGQAFNILLMYITSKDRTA